MVGIIEKRNEIGEGMRRGSKEHKYPYFCCKNSSYGCLPVYKVGPGEEGFYLLGLRIVEVLG